MKKRPFSDIEKIIADAANSHEAAYDENSWQKMEALLSSGKKRRRPFIFWFFLLFGLLLGGGYVLWRNNAPTDAGKAINLAQHDDKNLREKVSPLTVQEADMPAKGKENYPVAEDVKQGKNSAVSNQHSQTPLGIIFRRGPVTNKGKNKLKGRESMAVTSELLYQETGAISSTEAMQSRPVASKIIEEDSAKVIEPGAKPAALQGSVITVKDSLTEVISPETAKQKAAPSKKQTKSLLQKLYFSGAAGVETSGTGLFSGSQSTARLGIGLGYQVTKNLSLQTGVYSSAKKYVAGPGDYKTVQGSYWSTVDIRRIDASCRVYEIPLSLQFDFLNARKLQGFVTGGLSSYIMKKEDYSYFYYRGSNPYTAKASYTGNKHFFSVARISAGVAYRIKPALSLTAAPAISIPIKGVGEGAVKLYSTEFMVGLKYYPWAH